MKQILIVVLACLSCSIIYAQSDKKLKKQIDELTKQKTELEAELNRINAEIALIENRSFSRETPEQKLKKKLAWFKDVAALAKDTRFQQELKKTSDSLFNTYSLIIEMYLSLQIEKENEKEGGYQKEKNDMYKNQLGELKDKLSNFEPAHKESFIQSFEKMATQIKDYRFTMYELIRVFDLVDVKSTKGMENDKIYSSLKADDETEFIDEIPYTKYLLKKYIEADNTGRQDIREKYESFSTIK